MKEQTHYNRIRAEYNTKGRLFRNNVGTGYQGKPATCGDKKVIADPRFIEFGLCVGSSDLIGWTETVITPEMVGQKIAIFTAIEVKKTGQKLRKEQINFLKSVKNAGGLDLIEYV